MALSTVQVQFNGTWYNLTLDSATGLYKATITAPSTPQDDIPVLVKAVNDAGYQAEAETTVDVKWEIIPLWYPSPPLRRGAGIPMPRRRWFSP